jgi:hypothetical protein
MNTRSEYGVWTAVMTSATVGLINPEVQSTCYGLKVE